MLVHQEEGAAVVVVEVEAVVEEGNLALAASY